VIRTNCALGRQHGVPSLLRQLTSAAPSLASRGSFPAGLHTYAVAISALRSTLTAAASHTGRLRTPLTCTCLHGRAHWERHCETGRMHLPRRADHQQFTGSLKPVARFKAPERLLDLMPDSGPEIFSRCGQHLMQGAEGLPLETNALGR